MICCALLLIARSAVTRMCPYPKATAIEASFNKVVYMVEKSDGGALTNGRYLI
jgi:hypothetical protein